MALSKKKQLVAKKAYVCTHMVSRLKCEIRPEIRANDKKRSASWATVLTLLTQCQINDLHTDRST